MLRVFRERQGRPEQWAQRAPRALPVLRELLAQLARVLPERQVQQVPQGLPVQRVLPEPLEQPGPSVQQAHPGTREQRVPPDLPEQRVRQVPRAPVLPVQPE